MGHAYTTTLSDILARYHREKGDETYFLSGTDDHAFKVAQAAAKQGKDPALYVKEQGGRFKNLYSKLNISIDDFIQTSDEARHWPGAIEIWNRLAAAGALEKRAYKGLYCTGCESFKKPEDLVDGKCPDHNLAPVELEEENYFFKLSQYGEKLREIILSGEFVIRSEARKNEILALIDRGLEDVSFSRPKKSMSWGIPVPGDENQTMYVWCDALTNYVTALGFGTPNDSNYKKFWPAQVHMMGKDILRFHAAIWPAMLLVAGLPLPRALFVHGFITSGGRKMSKTIGNVIDPLAVIEEYGVDALRYYLAREISPFEDGDFTMDKFKEAYNGNLANGLGNLASRIMKMAESNLPATSIQEALLPGDYIELMDKLELQKAAELIWHEIGRLDQLIQKSEPFKLVKTDPDKGKELISQLVADLYRVACMLEPFLPETSQKIKEAVKANKSFVTPLFPRKD